MQKYEKYLSFFFLSENVQFLEINFSIYLNRRVFVMFTILGTNTTGQIDYYSSALRERGGAILDLPNPSFSLSFCSSVIP